MLKYDFRSLFKIYARDWSKSITCALVTWRQRVVTTSIILNNARKKYIIHLKFRTNFVNIDEMEMMDEAIAESTKRQVVCLFTKNIISSEFSFAKNA